MKKGGLPNRAGVGTGTAKLLWREHCPLSCGLWVKRPGLGLGVLESQVTYTQTYRADHCGMSQGQREADPGKGLDFRWTVNEGPRKHEEDDQGTVLGHGTPTQWLCGGQTQGSLFHCWSGRKHSGEEGKIGQGVLGEATQPGLRGLEELLEDHGQSREKQDPAPAAQSQESGPLENLS